MAPKSTEMVETLLREAGRYGSEQRRYELARRAAEVAEDLGLGEHPCTVEQSAQLQLALWFDHRASALARCARRAVAAGQAGLAQGHLSDAVERCVAVLPLRLVGGLAPPWPEGLGEVALAALELMAFHAEAGDGEGVEAARRLALRLRGRLATAAVPQQALVLASSEPARDSATLRGWIGDIENALAAAWASGVAP